MGLGTTNSSKGNGNGKSKGTEAEEAEDERNTTELNVDKSNKESNSNSDDGTGDQKTEKHQNEQQIKELLPSIIASNQKSLLNLPVALSTSMVQLINESKLNGSLGLDSPVAVSESSSVVVNSDSNPPSVPSLSSISSPFIINTSTSNGLNNHHNHSCDDKELTSIYLNQLSIEDNNQQAAKGNGSDHPLNNHVKIEKIELNNSNNIPNVKIEKDNVQVKVESIPTVKVEKENNNINNNNNNNNNNNIPKVKVEKENGIVNGSRHSSENLQSTTPNKKQNSNQHTQLSQRNRSNSMSSGKITPTRQMFSIKQEKDKSPIPFVIPNEIINEQLTSTSSSSSTTTTNTSVSPSPLNNNNIGGEQRKWSFKSYLVDELYGDYMPTNVDDTQKREQVYNFVHVPWELEKLLLFGFLICFENFLYLFTFLPIRIIISLLKLLSSPFTKKYKLTTTQIYDLFRAFIWCISFTFIHFIDSSMVYHYVRGQAVIKLYIIFNVLEVLDKLCCSFGQDIFDSLYWMSVSLSRPSTTPTTPLSATASTLQSSFAMMSKRLPDRRIFAPFTHTLICTVYVCVHSLVLFTQVITLNVAINSYNNALLTLIVSNNFVELKGSVFKRFEKENLFQMSCSDIVERFQIFIYLAIVFFQNLSDTDWDLSSEFALNMLGVVVAVWGSELLVDAIKHAFITKFNKITPKIYSKFFSILIETIVDARNKSFTESTWSITSTIGFVPFPLATIVARVFSRFMPTSGGGSTWFGIIVLVQIYICLVISKILIKLFILGICMRHQPQPSPPTTGPVIVTPLSKKLN